MNLNQNGWRIGRQIFGLAVLLLGGIIWSNSSGKTNQPAVAGDGGSIVLRVYYEDVEDIERLQSFDVWEFNNLSERYVLVATDHAGYLQLASEGWRIMVDESASATLSNRENRFDKFSGGYRTVDELYTDLEAINAAAPQLTELFNYGSSYCLSQGSCLTPGGDVFGGYPLRALRVTNEARPGASIINGENITRGSKPVFFLMANIHSREITTPEIAMRFLNHLIDGYGNDADATWLVDYHEIWVVPTANPDGHWLVELGDSAKYGNSPFYQRKNANNDSDGDETADCPVWPPLDYEQFGIDLNRNHSFGWGSVGSSDQPCNMTYRGPAAASEVEVASLENFLSALFADQRGPELNDAAPMDTSGLLITLHSFGNLVLWPWGDRYTPAPNIDGLRAIGDKFAFYNQYQSCQAGPCLYRTSGATDDWAYGVLGIPAFTFEMGNEFMPSYGIVDGLQWPNNAPAFIYAAKIAGSPYLTVRGPVVTNPQVTGDNPFLTITATIDDATNGSNQIASAVAMVDVHPLEGGAQETSLIATDGAFDGPIEAVSGSLPTTGLAPGRHILFVRGQDAAGNWGAVSATFFEVPVNGLLTEQAFLPIAVDQ